MAPRESEHEYFMKLCQVVASRGTCPRAKVGCVLVKDKRIISTGFNGSASTEGHCEDIGCLIRPNGSHGDSCVRTVHSEANAIAQAARFGIAVEGSIAYCTHTPCFRCVKLLKNAGIKKVLFYIPYSDDQNYDLLKELDLL